MANLFSNLIDKVSQFGDVFDAQRRAREAAAQAQAVQAKLNTTLQAKQSLPVAQPKPTVTPVQIKPPQPQPAIRPAYAPIKPPQTTISQVSTPPRDRTLDVARPAQVTKIQPQPLAPEPPPKSTFETIKEGAKKEFGQIQEKTQKLISPIPTKTEIESEYSRLTQEGVSPEEAAKRISDFTRKKAVEGGAAPVNLRVELENGRPTRKGFAFDPFFVGELTRVGKNAVSKLGRAGLREIAEHTNPAEIKLLLQRAGLSDEIAERLSQKLGNITDITQVEKEILEGAEREIAERGAKTGKEAAEDIRKGKAEPEGQKPKQTPEAPRRPPEIVSPEARVGKNIFEDLKPGRGPEPRAPEAPPVRPPEVTPERPPEVPEKPIESEKPPVVEEPRTPEPTPEPIAGKDPEVLKVPKAGEGVGVLPSEGAAVSKRFSSKVRPDLELEANTVIGARDPLDRISEETKGKIVSKINASLDEARGISKELSDSGFDVPEEGRRAFRDASGRINIILGESTRSGAGTPDRILLALSPDGKSGTIRRSLSPIEEGSFIKRSPKKSLEDQGNILGGGKGGDVPVPKSSPGKGGSDGTELRFGKAVKESPETSPELKKNLEERDLNRPVLPNKEIVDKAKARIEKSPDEAVAYITGGKEADAEQVATSIELIRKFQRDGRFEAAGDVAETIAEKLRRAGQTVQAAKLYAHLKPETILLQAQKIVSKLNAGKFRWQKDVKLGKDTIEQISTLAKRMGEATDPFMKVELGQEIQSILSKIPEPGILKKVSTIQTMAQLLNPKTVLTRNPLGNEIFYRLERVNKYAASAVDFARSTLTGADRQVTFHSVKQGEYWKNWLAGLKAGWKGVSPSGLDTQFEIHAPAFKEKWNPLTYLEKALGVSLRSFDHAAYKRGVNQTLGELGWLQARNEGLTGAARREAAKNHANNASDKMLQIADDYGKYITFQDNNVLSKTLSGVKKTLNLGQDFGIGDLVIKYPKTPGALIMRGLDYSPAGFLRSAYLVSEPFLKRGAKADVREIEVALSRAITGTLGLTGLGYYLADKGIITGRSEENKKVTGLEKSIGGGRYQVNLSALKRWALSGFQDTSIQENDRLYTYDWAQPVALALSLGANMNEAVVSSEQKRATRGLLAGVPGTAESSISGAIESITEQPLFTGIKNLFGGQGPVQAGLDVVEGMPSSFTPTLLNQFRQVVDPVQRETWNPSLLSRSINRVKARLPGLSESLPKRFDVFGKESKVMENPNAFNIFLNPGFTSTYRPTPAAQLVLEIYDSLGETKQLPRVAPRYLVFQGKRVNLTGGQISAFQENIGKATEAIFSGLAGDKRFQSLPNDKKADALNYVLGKIYAKQRFLILTPEQKMGLIEGMSPEQRNAFAKDLKSSL